MNWNLPKKAWDYTLFFSPAVMALLAVSIGPHFLPPTPLLRLANGNEIPDTARMVKQMLEIALKTLAIVSLIAAMIYEREGKGFERAVHILIFTIFLFFMNAFAAICGCAFVQIVRPN
jgi:hypothetical protein